jgi:hypothetical protein
MRKQEIYVSLAQITSHTHLGLPVPVQSMYRMLTNTAHDMDSAGSDEQRGRGHREVES